MTSVTKNPQPQPKIFFRVQSTRLADPFEPLNSSLAQSVEELGVCKATENCCFLGQNRSTNMSYTGSQSVNWYSNRFHLLLKKAETSYDNIFYKIKAIKVLSIIATVRSQILCQLTAKMICGLAGSEVRTVRMPHV